MTSLVDAGARPAFDIKARHVVAAVTGNALEFYDFSTYAFFAVQIGKTFFPGRSPFESLMLSLATFGVGFLGRPIGAALIGVYGDRVGRRPAMLLSLAMMGFSILALALTPSYAMIGMAAPVIVLIARIVQGLALGGEIGPTTAFLIEAAPEDKRGFYGCWQYASQSVATLAGGIVGFSLTKLLSPDALQDWGWRLAFVFGAAVLPLGLAIRRSLPETLETEETALTPVGPESLTGWRLYGRIIALGFVMISMSTVSTYVLSYMNTYATTTLHLAAAVGFAATITWGVIGFGFNVFGGWLSDRIGRKPVMVWPRVLYLLAIWPSFYLLIAHLTATTLLLAVTVMGALNAFSNGASLICLTEGIPKKVRSAALAVVYALGIAIFGGATQPLLAWLLHTTGDKLSPAYLLIGATALSIVAMAMMRETAPTVLRRKAA
jgi:MFS family permease